MSSKKNESLLRNCVACKNPMSRIAEACPKCGNPNPVFYRQKIIDECYDTIRSGEVWLSMHMSGADRKKTENSVKAARERLKKLGVKPPKPGEYSLPKLNSGFGCYIATAVYGSYDCPQVWTLRRFRDDILDETWYGRLFIKSYYAVSPTLVKWFGRKAWFQIFWKNVLDKLVHRLNSKGIEDTEYCDKY